MRGHHDVYIIKVGSTYRVRPPVWSSDGQGSPELRIRNLTDKTVEVTFPRKILSGPTAGPFTLGPASKVNGAGASGTIAVGLKPRRPKDAPSMHKYKVLVDGVPAEGESDPIVIIDPPPA